MTATKVNRADAVRSSSSDVAGLQRERIVEAVVQVVADRGLAGASVSSVCAHAGVSRRAFHAHFADLEAALLAVIDATLDRVQTLASGTLAREESSLDGLRETFAAVLGLFDREPALARVVFVETLGAGAAVHEQRERAIDRFRRLVVARTRDTAFQASPLAADVVLASVLGVVHAHVATRNPEPLVGLLGPLMGIVVAPCTDGAATAQEIELGGRLADVLVHAQLQAPDASEPATARIPDALLAPRAHRLRACLSHVAANPRASNAQVGASVGIAHRGHVSMLLARLSSLGLIEKSAGRPGLANAWSTTPAGDHAARAFKGAGEMVNDTRRTVQLTTHYLHSN